MIRPTVPILHRLGLASPCGTCEGVGHWYGGWGQYVACYGCGETGEIVSDRGERFLEWLKAEFEEYERRRATAS